MSKESRDTSALVGSAVTIVAVAALVRVLIAQVTTYNLAINVIWPILPFMLATIIGGVISLRVFNLSYEDLVRVILVTFVLVAAYTAITAQGGLGLADRVKQFLIYWIGASGGVFLLPLADPLARRGLNTRVFKRIGISLIILLVLLISVDTTLSRAQAGAVGLITFTLGALISSIGVGLGLILMLSKSRDKAVWAGSLGASLFVACYIVWLFFGSPWFP